MCQVIHTTSVPGGTTFVTSTYDMAIPFLFNRVNLLSDDRHKAVMNIVQYSEAICI